ncbi:MAG: phage baseplate assembly protein [Spirochaetota bacterium]
MPDALARPEITIDLTRRAERLGGWSGLTVTRSIDSCADAYSFSIPFEPTAENRDRFRPFKPVVMYVRNGDDLLLTGYIEKVQAQTGADSSALNVQGRSVTGGLLDWSAGPPFEFQGLTFNQIAEQAAAVWELDRSERFVKLDVKAVPDTAELSDVSVEIGQSVYDFLSSLAQANGLWAQPQPSGALRFSKIDSTRASVADLEEGTSPVLSVAADYDVTQRFQRYLVVSQNEGDPLAQYEIGDPEALGVGVRGRQIIELKQESASLREAALMARSRALIKSFQCSVVVSGWRNGERLWQPADIVRLRAPRAYIEALTRMIVKQVTFTFDENGGEIATLDLTLPEAYDQTTPRSLPWVG